MTDTQKTAHPPSRRARDRLPRLAERGKFCHDVKDVPGVPHEAILMRRLACSIPNSVFSTAAALPGPNSFFGALAEGWGIEEVNYSFEGHQIERKRGVRVLTSEELALKDVSLTYVSRLMNREYTRAPIFRKVLQSICWQVSSGNQVIVIGAIQPDNTVKGGTGWGAEFAKICNKPLLVFDQPKNGWFTWDKEVWTPVEKPVIEHAHFAATGTRFLEDNGRDAIQDLFARSFNR